jgi:hypothetical protein
VNRTDLLSRLWPLLKPPRHEYDECDECHGCDECNEYDGCDEGGILDSKEVRNCCQLLKRRQAAQCFPFLSFPFLSFSFVTVLFEGVSRSMVCCYAPSTEGATQHVQRVLFKEQDRATGPRYRTHRGKYLKLNKN